MKRTFIPGAGWTGGEPASKLRSILDSGVCPGVAMDCDWSGENGGRGRYIGQMADKVNDPKAYFRSRREVEDTASRRGFTTQRL